MSSNHYFGSFVLEWGPNWIRSPHITPSWGTAPKGNSKDAVPDTIRQSPELNTLLIIFRHAELVNRPPSKLSIPIGEIRTRCVRNTQCTSDFSPLDQFKSFHLLFAGKNRRIVLGCGPGIHCRRMLHRLVASRSIIGRIGVGPLSFLCFINYIPRNNFSLSWIGNFYQTSNSQEWVSDHVVKDVSLGAMFGRSSSPPNLMMLWVHELDFNVSGKKANEQNRLRLSLKPISIQDMSYNSIEGHWQPIRSGIWDGWKGVHRLSYWALVVRRTCNSSCPWCHWAVLLSWDW